VDIVLDKKSFSKQIEELVKEKPMPYMDAIIKCSTDLGLEVESAARLVNKNIKEKLEAEVQELNLLQKSTRLPL